MSDPDINVNTKVPAELAEWLRSYADREDLTVSQVVRRALNEYRAKAEGAARVEAPEKVP